MEQQRLIDAAGRSRDLEDTPVSDETVEAAVAIALRIAQEDAELLRRLA